MSDGFRERLNKWLVSRSEYQTFRLWYDTSEGVGNLRKLILENNYNDITYEPRTPYQINKYEQWKSSCMWFSGGLFILGCFGGYSLGENQFKQISDVSIYTSKAEIYRLRQSYRTIGALGYGVPLGLRAFVAVTVMLGVPALLGVYYNDTDHLRHYVASGTFCGVIAAVLKRRDFRTISQKVALIAAGTLTGLLVGTTNVVAEQNELRPYYDSYRDKWKGIEPTWVDYAEKHGTSNTSK